MGLQNNTGNPVSHLSQTFDGKVAGSNPGRSGRNISSPELSLCADSYSVSIPPPCDCNGT